MMRCASTFVSLLAGGKGGAKGHRGGGDFGGPKRARVPREPRPRTLGLPRSPPPKRHKPGLRSASSPRDESAPRLQIFDVNSGRYVDIKKDQGRGIRYHRLRHRLQQVLERGGCRVGEGHGDRGPPPCATGGGGGEGPAKTTSQKCLELATVLLERGFIEKLPATRGATPRRPRVSHLALGSLSLSSEALERWPLGRESLEERARPRATLSGGDRLSSTVSRDGCVLGSDRRDRSLDGSERRTSRERAPSAERRYRR